MAFDPTSAQPVQSSFDPTSAKLVGQSSFDPSSAVAHPAPSSGPSKLFDPNSNKVAGYAVPLVNGQVANPGDIDDVNPGQGVFRSAVAHNLLFQPSKMGLEATGYGMDQLKAQYPGQSDQWYQTHLHNAYTQAAANARQQADSQAAFERARDTDIGSRINQFAAGTAGSANPLWFLMPPGAGAVEGAVAKTAAKPLAAAALRTAGNAGVFGGLGFADDTAAQLLDVAEGAKKKYDVKQSLQRAAGDAVGGAVLHGVTGEALPAASDFVSDLFANRGRDTTPSSNPTMDTSPTTGNGPTLSPEDKTTLQQLYRTGSVDDIKNFFAGKQGPRPTWAQVNEMIKARDSLPQDGPNTNMANRGNVEQAFNDTIQDMHRQVVEDHINYQKSNWKNAPDVEVVNSAHDIQDPQVRQEALDDIKKNGNSVGFVSRLDGKVRVFAPEVKTPDQANALLYHEGLGHFGLGQLFGDRLDSTLQTLLDRNVGGLGKDTDQWLKDNPGTYNGNRLRAAEEVLAERSEQGPMKKSISDALVHNFKQIGRRMGLVGKDYSDAEVQHILSMAHDSVVNGKGAARFNGFKSKANPVSNSKWLNMEGKEPEPNYSDPTGQIPESATPYKANRFPGETGSVPANVEAYRANQARSAEAMPEAANGRPPEHSEIPANVEPYKANQYRHGVSEEEPSNNRYMYAGRKSKLFDPDSAFEGPDGNPRNEISDHEMRIKDLPPHVVDYTKDFDDEIGKKSMRLEDVIHHPELFKAYPQLRDMPVISADLDGSTGGYSRSNKMIAVGHQVGAREAPEVLAHEIQHAVQDIEGHPGGTNEAQSGADGYRRSFGEVEARDTENRLDMTPAMRRIRQPYINEGIHPSEYIFDRKSAVAAREGEDTNNRFMTPAQLNRSIRSGDYEVQQMEHAYKATDVDYVPTHESWEETIAKASKAGWDKSTIDRMGKTPDLAKRIFQYQAAAKVLDNRISGLLKKVDTPDLTEGDKDTLRQALIDHAVVLAKLRDDKAAAARALNISKSGYTRPQMESFGKILKERGGPFGPLGDDDTMIRYARQLKEFSDGSNPDAVNSMVESLSKPNWEDYITTLHHNFMLSGLSTHVKAPQDMMIGIGRELLNSVGALPISAGKEALRSLGVDIKPGIHPTEVAMRLWGILKAGMEADTWRNAKDAFINGGTNPQGYGGSGTARIPVVSKVTDLISAQDTFFRSFATNMHLYGLGARQALADLRSVGGKTDWDTVMNQASNYARNPHVALLREAREAADQTLLLNKNRFTQGLDAMKNVPKDADRLQRAQGFIANFLAPFVRVSSNSLWNRVVRQTPLASIVDKQTIADLKGGGAAADIAMSRMAMGTASIAAAWMAAGQGKVTGDGPDSAAKRAELEASGWRPNAVHENGQYNTGNRLAISLNPFDPHNETFSTVAAMREAYEKKANEGQVAMGIKLAAYAAIKHLTDMSYIHDIAPGIDAALQPGSAGEKMDRFLGAQASTLIPNALGQTARVADGNSPTTDDRPISGAVQAQIPGLRDQLPVQHTVYGDAKPNGQTAEGMHGLFGILQGNHVNEVTDPAEKELARLGAQWKEPIVTPVDRFVKVNGEKTRLSDREYQKYQQMAGTEIVETMRDAMSDPSWGQMSDKDKSDWVKQMQSDKKKAVREYLYGE